jgi:hypothetical protein
MIPAIAISKAYMTAEEKTGRATVLRIGAALQATLYAGVVTMCVWEFSPSLRLGTFFLVLVGFSVAFYSV